MLTTLPNPLAGDLDELLTLLPAAQWEALRGANIFVTGGTGFFGRWLLESFVHANARLGLNARLTTLTRDPAGFAARAPSLAGEAALRFVAGDVRTFDLAGVRAQLPAGEADAPFGFVIHAATDASAQLNAEDPLRMADTVADGTRRALEFARAAGTRRFLFTSSGAVYGPQPADVTHLDERYPGAPDPGAASSAYGEAKRYAELLCACFHRQHGLETLVARAFAFVGPHLPLDGHFAVGNFLADGLRGGPIRVAGDGTAMRSYLYASELAAALWTILLTGQPSRAYNVGSEEAVSIRELAETVARAFDPAPAVDIAGTPRPGAPVARYVPAVGRLREELGFRPRIGLAEAIARTKRWHERTGTRGTPAPAPAARPGPMPTPIDLSGPPR